MKRKCHFLYGILAVLFLYAFSFPQVQQEMPSFKKSIKSYLGFEYFSRTIKWNEEEAGSKLKSYFFTFGAEYELRKGFSLGAFLGYGFSDYEALIFRELPFSLELDAGGIGGFILGGEIKKSILSVKNLEIEGWGQFVYYRGGKEEWDIEGLNVEAKAEGKHYWMRAQIGPMFIYKGSGSFFPYLLISFNKLWGTFKMEETIEDLTGKEDKEISAKSLVNISPGFLYKITEALSFKGEAKIMPFKDGVDLGLMIRALYSF